MELALGDGWNLKTAAQSRLVPKLRLLSADLSEDRILLGGRILDLDAGTSCRSSAFGNSKVWQRKLPTCRAVGCTH